MMSKLAVSRAHHTVVERAQGEIQTRVALTEEMYGLLRLVEVVREYGFDRGTTTGGDGESELLVLQYDDPSLP